MCTPLNRGGRGGLLVYQLVQAFVVIPLCYYWVSASLSYFRSVISLPQLSSWADELPKHCLG